MKKILLSLGMIVFVGVIVAGATGAFFSDTETSTGNTFTAGAIDLTVDNTSYYNGEFNSETSWLTPVDLTNELFFNFDDLKPGDFGEDTISLHVDNNDSWLCAYVTLDSDDDNSITEPELEDGDLDTAPGIGDGDLADSVEFIWWGDDGDNVFETCEGLQTTELSICQNNGGEENLLAAGPLGALGVGNTATVVLADSSSNIFGDSGAVPGDSIRYIGKAWCFGTFSMSPVTQDNLGQDGTPGQGDSNGPDQRGEGFTCNGSGEDNKTQTDSMTATISFTAVQSRNNESFTCNPV